MVFVHDDITRDRFTAGTFDIVWSINTIVPEFMQANMDRAINNVYRSLARRGVFLGSLDYLKGSNVPLPFERLEEGMPLSDRIKYRVLGKNQKPVFQSRKAFEWWKHRSEIIRVFKEMKYGWWQIVVGIIKLFITDLMIVYILAWYWLMRKLLRKQTPTHDGVMWKFLEIARTVVDKTYYHPAFKYLPSFVLNSILAHELVHVKAAVLSETEAYIGEAKMFTLPWKYPLALTLIVFGLHWVKIAAGWKFLLAIGIFTFIHSLISFKKIVAAIRARQVLAGLEQIQKKTELLRESGF